MENIKICTSHKCEDCGKQLQPTGWMQWIPLILALIFIGGLVYGTDLLSDNYLYEARCWEEQDEFGVHKETEVRLVKQQPVRCDYFTEDNN